MGLRYSYLGEQRGPGVPATRALAKVLSGKTTPLGLGGMALPLCSAPLEV